MFLCLKFCQARSQTLYRRDETAWGPNFIQGEIYAIKYMKAMVISDLWGNFLRPPPPWLRALRGGLTIKIPTWQYPCGHFETPLSSLKEDYSFVHVSYVCGLKRYRITNCLLKTLYFPIHTWLKIMSQFNRTLTNFKLHIFLFSKTNITT